MELTITWWMTWTTRQSNGKGACMRLIYMGWNTGDFPFCRCNIPCHCCYAILCSFYNHKFLGIDMGVLYFILTEICPIDYCICCLVLTQNLLTNGHNCNVISPVVFYWFRYSNRMGTIIDFSIKSNIHSCHFISIIDYNSIG